MYTNWGGATSNFQIASNQLDVVSAGDTGPLLWSPTSFGATQQACVKLAAIDGNADDIALVLKAQSSTGLGSGLMEVLYDPTPGAIRIWTYDTTNDWVKRGTDLSATFAAGDTLRVVARSNGQVEIYKNTTLLGTRDASAWTYSAQGGYIGLLSYNGPNTLFDDFGGGTYAGASGPARADESQPVAKALRQPAERRIAERQPAEQQPAEQHSAALPSVVVDLGRVAERAAQAVADIQARAHTWGLRPAAAQPEPKGAAALFAPIQRAPLAVTPVSPIAGEVFRLYVSAGARPVAVRSIAAGGATSVQYLHPDHLGSIGQITDASQAWVQDMYFKPYGGVRWSQEPGGTGPDSDSATRRTYTGQYEEKSQWMGSLMHYKARYYSPFLHRFTQPDTILPGAGNPQNLNRFMYVGGNPTNANDPTGHFANWMIGAAIGAVAGAALYLANEYYGQQDLNLANSGDLMDLGAAMAMGAAAGALIATPGGQVVGVNMALSLAADHATDWLLNDDFDASDHVITGGAAALASYAGSAIMGTATTTTAFADQLIGKPLTAGTIGFVSSGLKAAANGEQFASSDAFWDTAIPAGGSLVGTIFGVELNGPYNSQGGTVIGKTITDVVENIPGNTASWLKDLGMLDHR